MTRMNNNMNITEQLFITTQQSQGLKRLASKDECEQVHMLSQQALVDAVRFPQLTISQQTMQRVNGSLPLFRRYKEIVKTLASVRSNMQAAASTQNKALITRKGDGFTLSVQTDPDNSDQAFLLLTLTQSAVIQPSDKLYLHIELHDQFWVLGFQSPNKDANNTLIWQQIMYTNSAEFIALSDADCSLYIV